MGHFHSPSCSQNRHPRHSPHDQLHEVALSGRQRGFALGQTYRQRPGGRDLAMRRRGSMGMGKGEDFCWEKGGINPGFLGKNDGFWDLKGALNIKKPWDCSGKSQQYAVSSSEAWTLCINHTWGFYWVHSDLLAVSMCACVCVSILICPVPHIPTG